MAGTLSKSRFALSALLMLSVAIFIAGCQKPVAQPALMRHYLSSNDDILAVSRVVFIEIGECGGYPKQAETMTEALSSALHEKDFHVDQIGLHHPSCRDLPLEQIEAFTIHQLQQMRQELKCDAVLFGKITQFHPYPRLKTQMYLRLLNLKDGKLLWAIDGDWDTTDKDTEKRIDYFFNTVMRSGYGPDQSHLAIISPRMFQKYIAWEIARTIPTRQQVYQQLQKLQQQAEKN